MAKQRAKELMMVALVDHAATPVVALDRRWCLDSRTTLTVKKGFTGMHVKNATTDETLLDVKHHEAPRGEYFTITDAKTNEQLFTLDRFSYGSAYDVFPGTTFQPTEQREQAKLTVHVDKKCTTCEYVDESTGAEAASTLSVEGEDLKDAVSIVTLHHPTRGFNAVARLIREKKLLRGDQFSLEIAAGVDVLLVFAVWLARWDEVDTPVVGPVTGKAKAISNPASTWSMATGGAP